MSTQFSITFRAELQRLVAAYDEHGGRWSQEDQDALHAAVKHARAVLAAAPKPADEGEPIPTAPAPAAEGEAEAVAIKLQQLAPQNPLGVADPTIARAAELLRQQAPAPAPADEAEGLPPFPPGLEVLG